MPAMTMPYKVKEVALLNVSRERRSRPFEGV